MLLPLQTVVLAEVVKIGVTPTVIAIVLVVEHVPLLAVMV